MSKYSLIPATITTNISSGTCTISKDNCLDLSFITYAPLPEGYVYKACLGRINSSIQPLNLGTALTEGNRGKLIYSLSDFPRDMAVIIYMKDTISLDVVPEAYCLICDNDICDIAVTKTDSGEFGIRCTFADDTPSCDDEDATPSAIEHAQSALDEYREAHPPSDASLNINKKYFEKITSALSSYKPFQKIDYGFDWYVIDSFDTIANLSAIKYVLFDTLAVNAFDTYKHYLFGVKKEQSDDDGFVIAIAIPSIVNPLVHLYDYFQKIPYSDEFDYFAAFLQLAPDGQYFLSPDSVYDFEDKTATDV